MSLPEPLQVAILDAGAGRRAQRARKAAHAVLAAREQLLHGRRYELGDAVPWHRRIDPVWRDRHLYAPTLRIFRRRARS